MSCRVIFCLVLVLVYDKVNLQLPECDKTINSDFPEGNIGEISQFPWLGVLRVHSHKKDILKIGLTGLVLIKRKYAIVNADDVAQIPTGLFKRDCKAMFVVEKQKSWFCEVKNFQLHPEYEYSTYNTIALVELDYENNDYSDYLIPICLPDNNYNTSNHLYALGFVDDNRFLEKIIHKIRYIKQELCEDFYNRVGFKDKSILHKPTSYYCGFASNNKNHCVWDNGMALASNTTGVWVLIGFGIKGPGCTAPSRFIQMFSYLEWIQSATDEIEEF